MKSKTEKYMFQLVVDGVDDLLSLAKKLQISYYTASRIATQLAAKGYVLKRKEGKHIKILPGKTPLAKRYALIASLCNHLNIDFAELTAKSTLKIIDAIEQNKPQSAKEIQLYTGLSYPTIIKKLKILENAGIISRNNKIELVNKTWANILIKEPFSTPQIPAYGKIAGITPRTAEAIYKEVVKHTGGEIGHINSANLEFTLSYAANQQFSKDKTEDIIKRAAMLLTGIIQGHPFLDGNKRMGWVLSQVFLRLNGFHVEAKTKEIVDLCLGIAQGKKDFDTAYMWLKNHVRRI